MRILYICHRFPFPPNEGGKIRPFHMIKHLAETHDVTVASLVRSSEESRGIAKLQELCHKVLARPVSRATAGANMARCLFSSVPASFGFSYSSKLQNDIDRELARNQYDLIFVHCSAMARYVERVRDVPKLLDFGDMDSQKWLDYARHRSGPMAIVYLLEGHKLRREEKRLAHRFDGCTVTTPAELDTIHQYGIETHSDWFSNGVDTDYFSPSTTGYDPDLISFVGRMDYYPNAQSMLFFCHKVLPRIQQRRPNTRLAIVGAHPSRSVEKLSRIKNVDVTGTVDDVRPYLGKSAVNVAPLQIARGIQNKILEAMAMAVPVVASELAARGIDGQPGEHLLTASSADQFARAVFCLLDDADERNRIGNAGRAIVESRYVWANTLKKLDDLIDLSVRNGPGRLVRDSASSISSNNRDKMTQLQEMEGRF